MKYIFYTAFPIYKDEPMWVHPHDTHNPLFEDKDSAIKHAEREWPGFEISLFRVKYERV